MAAGEPGELRRATGRDEGSRPRTNGAFIERSELELRGVRGEAARGGRHHEHAAIFGERTHDRLELRQLARVEAVRVVDAQHHRSGAQAQLVGGTKRRVEAEGLVGRVDARARAAQQRTQRVGAPLAG